MGAVGCLNVVNAFCFFLDLTILMLNRFVGLPCSRLHSNTQFEAKVRELLKDRLILRAALYSHNRKTRLPLAVRRGSYWLVIAIWISVCYCVHHAIMRVFGVCCC